MGLSISHRIITDHRGSIKCKSRRKGTVFEISLPAAKEEASADILPGVASHTSEGRKHVKLLILVCHKDSSLRRIKDYLEEEYTLLECEPEQKAIDC